MSGIRGYLLRTESTILPINMKHANTLKVSMSHSDPTDTAVVLSYQTLTEPGQLT